MAYTFTCFVTGESVDVEVVKLDVPRIIRIQNVRYDQDLPLTVDGNGKRLREGGVAIYRARTVNVQRDADKPESIAEITLFGEGEL